MQKKILVVFGTRPEAIKLAPVIIELRKYHQFEIKICVSGQHREMLDQVLKIFSLTADYDLNLMNAVNSLSELTAKILFELSSIMKDFQPNLVIVHGDTTTTFSTSLAAFYEKIPVAHVEAGLRTGDLNSPWPEEANRKFTSIISKYHFPPTKLAQSNLLNEGIKKSLTCVTGNTVVDALILANKKLSADKTFIQKCHSDLPFLDSEKKIILVTGHRRENFGYGLEQLCGALIQLSSAFPEIQIVYPVHLNPNVQEPVIRLLSNLENVFLIPPQDYLPFVYLMSKSYLILTDSGGIQEEAPTFGKPVLVTRDTTERPEGISTGTARLLGTSTDKIISTVSELIKNESEYAKMARAINPYGDGKASKKICEFILKLKSL